MNERGENKNIMIHVHIYVCMYVNKRMKFT